MATTDFSRGRIDAMINLNDPLAVLATRLAWDQIEAALTPISARRDRQGVTSTYVDLFGPSLAVADGGLSNAGRPRLPIRLMTSLLYLKHSVNLSDEEVVQRWSKNVLWQFFSGTHYYEHRLPCDATQIGRFRGVVREGGLEQLLKAPINTAVDSKAAKPEELERVIVDTVVQEKAIAHSVESRLLEVARHAGIVLKQTCKGRQATSASSRRLCARQAVQAAAARARASALDPGRGHSRGSAQTATPEFTTTTRSH